MSLDDGRFDEMPRRPDRPALPPLDDDTAARVLAGELAPPDAPPGYAAVATLLAAAAAPPRPEELAGEGAARATFAVARADEPARRRRRPTRLVVLVAAGVLCLGGVAAAATTGALPGPVQSAARDALATVGVSVPPPHPASSATRPPPLRHAPVTTTPAPPRVTQHPVAPHVPTTAPHVPPPPRTVPPHTGAPSLAVLLCRAAASGRLTSRDSPPVTRAYETLVQLAGGAGNIPGYCRGVLGG